MNETGARDSGWAWPSVGRWRDTSVETSASPARELTEAASKSSSPTPVAPTQLPATSGANSRTVLIVEDNRPARTAITKLLKRQGFAVSEAATVAEAMAQVEQTPPPQWILLDLMLPDGCGISVLQRVRAAALPCTVCVITGCADSQLLGDARRAGAEHTFTKPLDFAGLMALMCA